MEEILQTLQEEFQAAIQGTATSVKRRYTFPEAKNMVKVAVGMRRAGKTYFLFQTIRDLLHTGIPIERILYLNFEDDRLLPMSSEAMGKMIDAFYTLNPENHQHCCYIFLDEVQNIEGWPLVIRRLQDTKNVQIYVTGSSAKLLSKEIATSLRGRSLTLEILPYSYQEFLDAHHLKHPVKPFGKRTFDEHRRHLQDYFRVGGFPGIQEMAANEQLETLQNYVETVVFRDIVERHQIANVTLLMYFIGSLIKNVASPFSINKFYNDIKSQGFKIGKDTLHTYIDHLEDAFLIFPVPIFTESLRQMQTTPKKIYAIDNGLINANTFNMSENLGKLLENLVYLDLRRQKKKIFYYKTSSGYEIDFVTQDIKGKYEILQVVWEAHEQTTKERELRALEQAKEELGFPGKLIDWTSYLKNLPD